MVSYLRVAKYYENLVEKHTTMHQERLVTALYRAGRADIFPTIFETWAELSLVSDITKMPENELCWEKIPRASKRRNSHNNIRDDKLWELDGRFRISAVRV